MRASRNTGRARVAEGGTSSTTAIHGGGSNWSIRFVLMRSLACGRTRAGRKSYFPIVISYVMRRWMAFLVLVSISTQLVVAVLETYSVLSFWPSFLLGAYQQNYNASIGYKEVYWYIVIEQFVYVMNCRRARRPELSYVIFAGRPFYNFLYSANIQLSLLSPHSSTPD